MKHTSPIWHPYTQHALFPESVFIERAEGTALYGQGGRRIIDAISSWWVNVHGHGHPKIIAAVQAQAEKLDQIIFAGFTHAPAETLAEKLVAITPPALRHVFYSDSGSTAVEVALKMAIGFFAHQGKPRSRIVALEGGYHGDTFGTMAAGGRSAYNALYAPYLFDVTHLPFPSAEHATRTLEMFEALLKKGDVAALIVEPLILGAGGMQVYSPETLRALHTLCKNYGALFIADEVMTAWGRTGTRFACEQAGITPDLLCLSKGLTNGFLPLAATLATPEIYAAFYHKDRSKMFFHSSSYTANPLACAAGCASLSIWEEEPVLARIARLTELQKNHLASLQGHKNVLNPRQCGTIAAFDIAAADEGYLSNLAPTLYRFFLEKDVLLRPLGNTIYIMPPYCISDEDMKKTYAVVEQGLEFIAHRGSERAA